MKVYVIMQVFPYEGLLPHDVYTNEEEAKKHVETLNNQNEDQKVYWNYYKRELKNRFDGL